MSHGLDKHCKKLTSSPSLKLDKSLGKKDLSSF